MMRITLFIIISFAFHLTVVMWGANDQNSNVIANKNIASKKIFFSVKPQAKLKKSTAPIAKTISPESAGRSKVVSNKSVTDSDLSSTAQNGMKLLDLSLTYPADAIRKKLTGSVIVQVSFGADGQVQSKKIIKSSGHQILDRTVMLALEHGHLKEKVDMTQGTLTLSFSFQL